MSFKIVQTIENEQLCLVIVTATWEEGGTLWWPNQKGQLGSLLRNPNSYPDKTKWEKIHCLKKRRCDSYKDAEKELRLMENNSDTEADTNLTNQSQNHKQITPIRRKAEKRSITFPDFNEDISLILNNNVVEFKDQGSYCNTNETTHHNSTISIPLCKETILTSSQLETIEVEDFQNINESAIDDTNQNDIVVLLNTVLANQDQIIKNIAKIQTQIDTLGTIVSKRNVVNDTTSEVQKRDLLFDRPISSLEELEHFENKLKDEGYLNKIIESMSFICGSNGKQNGFDCCYKLVDIFLDRKFVTHCSWTGNTRAGQGVTKVPLKFFEKFRLCFLKLIIKADNTFGEKECDEFFKRIMKNSQQRKTAKGNIESKHKCRPKNLQYKKPSALLVKNVPHVEVIEVDQENLSCLNNQRRTTESESDADAENTE